MERRRWGVALGPGAATACQYCCSIHAWKSICGEKRLKGKGSGTEPELRGDVRCVLVFASSSTFFCRSAVLRVVLTDGANVFDRAFFAAGAGVLGFIRATMDDTGSLLGRDSDVGIGVDLDPEVDVEDVEGAGAGSTGISSSSVSGRGESGDKGDDGDSCCGSGGIEGDGGRIDSCVTCKAGSDKLGNLSSVDTDASLRGIAGDGGWIVSCRAGKGCSGGLDSGGTDAMRNLVGDRRGEGGTLLRSRRGTTEEMAGTETARRYADEDGCGGWSFACALGLRGKTAKSCRARLKSRSWCTAESFPGDKGRLSLPSVALSGDVERGRESV